ncbi:ArnT family glycosyltransferase [Nocardioides sambongensis]|uniref:ArnT family glycosyltransferase n=1 Tax=Nocardioides sambongensis TaxID=2589074 RepID=UPI001126F7C1|nr:glycosyltransferase family 39 protein [Nocardioides sambongensis]
MTTPASVAATHERPRRRRRASWPLVCILLVALTVRLVALRHGLPHAYNADEELHYVPQATRAADGDWYSGYFENPSGFTYLVALVYRVVFAGQDVTLLLVDDPTAVLVVARLVAALLGTAAVAAVYAAGRAYAGHRVGLCAAAFLGLAYLPVFYSHQALNDVPTLLPTAVALAACLRYLDGGRRRDLLLAGAAVGLAAGIKYLAAPMALVVAAAVLIRVRREDGRISHALLPLAAAGLVCIGALLLLNPFLAVEFDKFLANFTGQSAQAATAKLGQTGSAWLGYPASLLWGFGVLPTALAVAGAVLGWRADRGRALLLVLFPLVLLVTMSVQGRYFGRWMLPAYPALAVLAGYGAVRSADLLNARLLNRRVLTARLLTGRLRGAPAALAAVMVVGLAQPATDVLRSDVVLSRTDTREAALVWMRREIPAGQRLVLEPAFPGSYRRSLRDAGLALASVPRPFQEYELRLRPSLVDGYRSDGYCWVVVSGHQHDRGLAAGLADAAAYYAHLRAESDLVFRATPFADDSSTDFSYDFSFNYYPPAHRRPGPVVEIYRLRDCADA